jgi:cytochrome c oxidase subunit III
MASDRKILYHPYNIMMVLLLSALTMVFVGLSAAYLYTRFSSHEAPIKVPLIFLFNTLILFLSSICLRFAKKYYLEDETDRYKFALVFTILFTLIFMTLQYIGWKELLLINPNLAKGNMAAYVYAISIIHFIHIIGGLPFMLAFIINAMVKMREPVSVLIYFSDPLKRMKLRLLTLYWNFLDILWMYLMLFFWINYFIKI